MSTEQEPIAKGPEHNRVTSSLRRLGYIATGALITLRLAGGAGDVPEPQQVPSPAATVELTGNLSSPSTTVETDVLQTGTVENSTNQGYISGSTELPYVNVGQHALEEKLPNGDRLFTLGDATVLSPQPMSVAADKQRMTAGPTQ